MILRKLLKWVAGCVTLAPLQVLAVMLLMTGVCSCSRTQYVSVPQVSTDSVYVNKQMRDSVFLRDSVFVKEKGDTVYVSKWRYVYKDKIIRDTMYVAQVDSIRVPYAVERKLSRWQRMKMELGGVAMGGIGLLALIGIGRLIGRIGK